MNQDALRELKPGDLLLHCQSLVIGYFVRIYEPGEFVDFNGSHLPVPAVEISGGHIFGVYGADTFLILPHRAKHILNAVYMSLDYALSELHSLISVLGLQKSESKMVIRSILKTTFEKME